MAAKRTKKGEPGEIDVRPLVLGVSPAAEGRNIDFDWTGLYVSPVFVLQSVDSEFSLLSASLTKADYIFQFFFQKNIYISKYIFLIRFLLSKLSTKYFSNDFLHSQ